jgi:hypothetical protein
MALSDPAVPLMEYASPPDASVNVQPAPNGPPANVKLLTPDDLPPMPVIFGSVPEKLATVRGVAVLMAAVIPKLQLKNLLAGLDSTVPSDPVAFAIDLCNCMPR